MKKEKIDIKKAIEYLKQVSLKEPIEIRVEEIQANRIVLSFKENDIYNWGDRLQKEFNFKNGKIISMKPYAKPKSK